MSEVPRQGRGGEFVGDYNGIKRGGEEAMTVFTPTFGSKGFMDRMHNRMTVEHDMTAAVIAGQFAGLVMAVVVMLVFGVILGKSPLFPVQVIGSLFFGDQ